MPDLSTSAFKGRIKIDRKAWSQEEIEEQYKYSPLKTPSITSWLRRQCRFSVGCLGNSLLSCVPITRWLPKYERSFLLSDMIAGLTVGIFLVPQSMAYASLAGLAPVYGLYSSFFPSLLYMIFGTSRHVSHGVFAVVSLMTHTALIRILPGEGAHSQQHNENSTTTMMTSSDGDNLTPIIVVTALTFAVGLIQLLMALLRLSFLTTYLSDQVIGGFTTGAACHVLASQLNKIIDVKITNYNGLFKLYYIFRDIIEKIPQTHVPTLIMSIVCLVFLVVGKEYINPMVRKRLPIPVPFELIAVVIATTLSYFFKFESKYNMTVVSHIPTGFPIPKVPHIDLVPRLLGDAVGIAMVTFVVTVSVGKLFAKKHRYSTNPSQELRALGIIQIIISFLSCHPASGGLSRSLLNEQMGVKTQLSQVFCGSLLLVVILWIGPLLEPLPTCILASIIIVALKGMFMQLKELKTLWPVSKIDFSVWLVGFGATICWDVAEGLIIAVVFALFTIIIRLQWPKSVELGRLSNSDLYRDATRFQEVDFLNGVRVFRFDAPLLFTNIDLFKKRAQKLVAEGADGKYPTTIRALVIDGSGVICIDCMGVNALKEISADMKQKHINVYLASFKAPVREMCQAVGFDKTVLRFYPSIQDAILRALSDASMEEELPNSDRDIDQISHM